MTNCPPLTRGLEGEGWGDFRERPTPSLWAACLQAPLYMNNTPCHLGAQGRLGKKGRGADASPHRGPSREDTQGYPLPPSPTLPQQSVSRRSEYRRSLATTTGPNPNSMLRRAAA